MIDYYNDVASPNPSEGLRLLSLGTLHSSRKSYTCYTRGLTLHYDAQMVVVFAGSPSSSS